MNAVAFDTLILSRKLAAAGLSTEQAQGVAAALAETLGEQIATRRDLADVSRDVIEVGRAGRAHTDQVEARLSARIDQVEAASPANKDRVVARLDRLEARMDARFDALTALLRESERRQAIDVGAMAVTSVAVVATLAKLL